MNGTLDAPLYAFNTILLNYAEATAELGEADDDVLNKRVNLLRAGAGILNLTVSFANSFQVLKKRRTHQEYLICFGKLKVDFMNS